jgi:hypothetical protein
MTAKVATLAEVADSGTPAVVAAPTKGGLARDLLTQPPGTPLCEIVSAG